METGFPVGTDVTDRMLDAMMETSISTATLARLTSGSDSFPSIPLFKIDSEWVPSVRDKIKRHSCLMILMLDIDGFRYDKGTNLLWMQWPI